MVSVGIDGGLGVGLAVGLVGLLGAGQVGDGLLDGGQALGLEGLLGVGLGGDGLLEGGLGAAHAGQVDDGLEQHLDAAKPSFEASWGEAPWHRMVRTKVPPRVSADRR